MNFSALDDSIAALEKAAANFNQAEAKIATLSPEKRKALNAELALAERKLTSDQGLPRRPWVKHVLYAPGVYTGYGAKTIPGVREALEQGRFDEAQEQIGVVAKALQSEAAFIDQIAVEFASGQ
jgi:N-acetylated-alpha-linked acidic dipeptidase